MRLEADVRHREAALDGGRAVAASCRINAVDMVCGLGVCLLRYSAKKKVASFNFLSTAARQKNPQPGHVTHLPLPSSHFTHRKVGVSFLCDLDQILPVKLKKKRRNGRQKGKRKEKKAAREVMETTRVNCRASVGVDGGEFALRPATNAAQAF